MSTAAQRRRICTLYYLDVKPIDAIAKEVGVSRREVRAAIDDPTTQEEFLQRAEAARRRARVRAACAADAALERQVELITADVDAKLVPAQQRTAQALLNRALREEDKGEIRITFANEIKLGMPPPLEERD